MRKIYKYELLTENVQFIETYSNFEPLTIEVQNEKPVLYAIIDDETEKRSVKILTYGTGFVIGSYVTDNDFIGTYMLCDNSLVFHVFIGS